MIRWCVDHPEEFPLVAQRMADYHIHYPPWKVLWKVLQLAFHQHGVFPSGAEIKQVLHRIPNYDPDTLAHLCSEAEFLYSVTVTDVTGEQVRNFVTSRELEEISALAASLAVTTEGRGEELPRLLRRMEDLAMLSGRKGGDRKTFSPYDLRDVSDVRDFFEEMYGGGVVPTGLSRLDNRLKGGGMQSHLTLVVGPTGGGKSTFALNLALHNLSLGKRVVYFALDDSRGELLERIGSHLLRVDVTEVEWDLDTYHRLIREKLQAYPGQWYGEEVSPDEFTPEDLAGHLKMLQYQFLRDDRKRGVPEEACGRIDLVVVDSGDQLRVDSKGSDTWMVMRKMFERCTLIPKRFGCNLTMTVQSNQEGVGASQITVRNTGESYGKVKPAKLILGFAQTISQRHEKRYVNWADEKVKANLKNLLTIDPETDRNTAFHPWWLCIMKNTRARSVDGPASWVKLPMLVDYSTCRVAEDFEAPEELILEDKKTRREEREADGDYNPRAGSGGKRGSK